MGLLDSLGVSGGLGIGEGPNWAGVGNVALIGFIVLIVVIIAGVWTFLYYSKKIKKTLFKNQIPIFVTIHGKHTRVAIDYAKELFIPDSNISLFYLRSKKIYIARPTRAMAKNEYWYAISENGEWVNFDLSSDPKDNTLAQANYDHRDTRYAYVNLKDIIKRNYSDKSVKWWKEYSPLITFIICAFIFIGGCWILLAKIGKLVEMLGPIAENMVRAAESMGQSVQTAQNLNSGIVPG